MTDAEMIELAAKAAGKSGKWDGPVFVLDSPTPDECSAWHPIDDNRAALGLAIALRLEVKIKDYGAAARQYKGQWYGFEAHMHGGIENATRRAIVRAAAAAASN